MTSICEPTPSDTTVVSEKRTGTPRSRVLVVPGGWRQDGRSPVLTSAAMLKPKEPRAYCVRCRGHRRPVNAPKDERVAGPRCQNRPCLAVSGTGCLEIHGCWRR
jgi:hypothetical protein